MSKSSYKKLSLFDLAAARAKKGFRKADARAGDLIEIIEPFTQGENFIGIVLSVGDEVFKVYHADGSKIIEWNRRVKCNVYRV